MSQISRFRKRTGYTSVRFNGTNQYGTHTSNVAAFHVTTRSLEAWVKLETVTSTAGLFSLGGTNYYFGFSTAANMLISYNNGSGSQKVVIAPAWSTPILDWIHIVYTVETVDSDVTCKFYINGSLIHSVVNNDGHSTSFSSSTTCNLARIAGGNYFSGQIGYLKLYNVALTDQDVKDRYFYDKTIEGKLVEYVFNSPATTTQAVTTIKDVDNLYTITTNNTPALIFESYLSNSLPQNISTNNKYSIKQVSTTSGMNFGTHATYAVSQGSVSFWTKIDNDTSTGNTRLFSMQGGTGKIEIYYASTNTLFDIIQNNSSTIDNSGFKVPAYDTWLKFIITWGSSGFKIYINGTLMKEVNEDSTINWGESASLYLGRYYSASGYGIKGYFYDFTLTNSQPTDEDVLNNFLYNKQLPNIVSYWSFNNINDIGTNNISLTSGTGNDGTISGGYWTQDVAYTTPRMGLLENKIKEIPNIVTWFNPEYQLEFDTNNKIIGCGEIINNYRFHQSTASRPTFGSLNGKAVLSCATAGLPCLFQIPEISFKQQITFFVVAKFASTAANLTIFGWFDSTAGHFIVTSCNAPADGTLLFTLGGRQAKTTNTVLTDTVISITFDGSQSVNSNKTKIWFNGVQETLTYPGGEMSATRTPKFTPTNTPGIGYRPGSGYAFSGTLGDIIIFNRNLSDTERVYVENYLKNKYGL